ncbi:MAG TPA: ketopantoate reductase family protein [Bacteroidales bacterium]|nr:ketopantoate reductase family protein [Bacteroidales bacterium]
MKNNFSILVVGAGAIGGITAALMKNAGYDVTIATRDEKYASLIINTGLEINGVCGHHIIRMPAITNASIAGKKDVIIIATKNADMISAANSYMAALKETGVFVFLQNGILEKGHVSDYSKHIIIDSVTGWGATMETHGKLLMTSEGDFIIGYPDKEPDELLQNVSEILSSVVPVITTGNIIGHKYSKLIINSCITSLGAICGLYLGDMLSRKKIRKIFIEIIREAVAVSEKMNLKIEVFAGKLNFKDFLSDENLFADLKRHLMIRIIGFKYRKLKSSSLQSLERGQKTEVDFLNGYITNTGNALGVSVPVNTTIVRMIHEIEEGRRSISPANFDEQEFERFR